MTLTTQNYRDIFVTKTTFLDDTAFDQAVKNAETTKKSLEQVLMERTYISTPQYLQLLSDYCNVPSTELRLGDIDRKVLKLMTPFLAEKLQSIAFKFADDSVHVAMADPTDTAARNELQQSLQQTVTPYVTTEQAIKRALMLYEGDIHETLDKVLDANADAQGEDALRRIVDALIETAVMLDASDIHLEPFEDNLLIRMRVEGILRIIAQLPSRLAKPLVAHLKIRAELKVDELRLPQDGRFAIATKGQEIDVRISLVPSMWGEKAVMRILPKEARMLDITTLGLLDDDVQLIRSYLRRPYGTILVCGPTGCGKTTTLYAFLQSVSSERIDVVNISTVEDPIEYTIPRVTQIQTKPSINLTFAVGLRALLRQDPDIIMVGEIRDSETANFAVRASLIGRLVLSSLHTNDAVGSIPRLLDMGIEPYLVSSTLSLVIAQRLARKLCTYCRESYVPDDATMANLRDDHDLTAAIERLSRRGLTTNNQHLRFYKAIGCEHCDGTGYAGRIALFEVMEMTDNLRRLALQHSDATTLRQAAVKDGMKTLFDDGVAKALTGVVSLDELLRVAYD